MKWIPLENLDQLANLREASEAQPQLIFKHSTRCFISKSVLRQWERAFHLDEEFPCYFLDLIAHRDISNAIAQTFEVEHQSPQMLVIHSDQAIYQASHSDIDAEAVELLLAKE